jgi:hypothetical protein
VSPELNPYSLYSSARVTNLERLAQGVKSGHAL